MKPEVAKRREMEGLEGAAKTLQFVYIKRQPEFQWSFGFIEKMEQGADLQKICCFEKCFARKSLDFG